MDIVVVLDDVYNIPNSQPSANFIPDRIRWAKDLTLKGISARIRYGFTPSWMAKKDNELHMKDKALVGKLSIWNHRIGNIWDNLKESNRDTGFIGVINYINNIIDNSHCA